MPRKRSNKFEDWIQNGFAEVRKTTGAWLVWINPPVTPIGLKGKMPIFAMTGSALFDLGGWTNGNRAAKAFIGVELKETRQHHPSLPIIRRDRKGSGLQHHQIEALAGLHRDGHIAGLLWSNGGIVGWCDGEVLAAAYYEFEVSLAAEDMGKAPKKGARSISWQKFSPVMGDKPEDWYMEKVHREKPA
jgi:hypothetical protein